MTTQQQRRTIKNYLELSSTTTFLLHFLLSLFRRQINRRHPQRLLFQLGVSRIHLPSNQHLRLLLYHREEFGRFLNGRLPLLQFRLLRFRSGIGRSSNRLQSPFLLQPTNRIHLLLLLQIHCRRRPHLYNPWFKLESHHTRPNGVLTSRIANMYSPTSFSVAIMVELLE